LKVDNLAVFRENIVTNRCTGLPAKQVFQVNGGLVRADLVLSAPAALIFLIVCCEAVAAVWEVILVNPGVQGFMVCVSRLSPFPF
jgi:hypothetical protein